MSIQTFQTFISSDPELLAFGTCVKDANILNLSAQTVPKGRNNLMPTKSRVALVVDGENGLDRLYGGFFPDWVCGGQWAHMVDYLADFITTLTRANVQAAFFFNGALEADRFEAWRSQQLKIKENVVQALRHIHKKGTPPPKAWWVPPCAIQTMLKLSLQFLNASVITSVEDHRQEVMNFCWENGYHGIVADDPEYALANPPRLLSFKHLKMTFQFDVKSVEYVMDEIAMALDVNPNRFCLLATLLGNHILSPSDLQEFHLKIAPEVKDPINKVGFERVIRAVVNYIRTLPKMDDFEQLGNDIFGSSSDPRIKKLKSSLQYFISLSEEGYRKHKKSPNARRNKKLGQIKVSEKKNVKGKGENEVKDAETKVVKNRSPSKPSHADLVERIALDLEKIDLNAISAAAEALKENVDIVEEMAGNGEDDDGSNQRVQVTSNKESEEEQTPTKSSANPDPEDKDGEISVLQALASGKAVQPSEDGKYPGKRKQNRSQSDNEEKLKPIQIPDLHANVYKTALERHRQSQMCPYIYQLLTRGEIKLPVLMEDYHGNPSDNIPPIHNVFRPVRKVIYAILFNLKHQKFSRRQLLESVKGLKKRAEEYRKQANKKTCEAEKKELMQKAEDFAKQASEIRISDPVEIRVREWHPYNDYRHPESVEACDINWSVPTIQTIWFGSSAEDKQRRLRAFLSCFQCDNLHSVLTQANIPQHLLMLTSVLRYLMQNQEFAVFRKFELDALLATVFSPEIGNRRYLSELKIDMITKRGIKLAALIMQGIEMAIFANHACGAPIPVHMCLPWTFFDGKLFQYKLRRAELARNLFEVCDGVTEIYYIVEKMRAVILHGLCAISPSLGYNPNPMMIFGSQGAGRGGQMLAKGGKLVVGGTVVGQWGTSQMGQNSSRKKKKASSKKKTLTDEKKVTTTTESNPVILASRTKENLETPQGKELKDIKEEVEYEPGFELSPEREVD